MGCRNRSGTAWGGVDVGAQGHHDHGCDECGDGDREE